MSTRFRDKCKPFTLFCVQTLGLGELKPTNLTLFLADRSVKVPKRIVEDVILKVDEFYFSTDFVVLTLNQLEIQAILIL